MKVNSKVENNEVVIEIRLDLHDQLCLKDDLLDIVKWFSEGPSAEKIANCRSRMILENKDQLLASPEFLNKTMAQVNAILSDPVKLVEAISKMPGYKNRAQREAAAPPL